MKNVCPHEEETIKRLKWSEGVSDVIPRYSALDRAALDWRSFAGFSSPSQTEFRDSPLAAAKLVIPHRILCTLFHIPGTVSGSMWWCQKSHCCCVLYIFFSLGLALSSLPPSLPHPLARHLPLVVSPISLLSVPHCVISVSVFTWLWCSAVLKEEDHFSTAALHISIFPLCGHTYAGIEHYTICDCWTSIFICSHSATRVLIRLAWPCSQSVFRLRLKVRALCKPFLHWPGFVHEEDKPIRKTDKRVKDSTSLIHSHRCKEDLFGSAVKIVFPGDCSLSA